MVMTNFYDDFPSLAFGFLQDSDRKTAELALKLLGWEVNLKPHKALPFSKQFEPLGVLVDLSETDSGTLTIKNKASRIKALDLQVSDILARQTLSHPEAASLKGKFAFASSQCFGRCGITTMQALSAHERSARSSTKISSYLEDSLRWMIRFLKTTVPRTIKVVDPTSPLLLFTDGACEEEGALTTCGAILFDPEKKDAQMFGFKVDDDTVAQWKATGIKQVIGQAEILPVLVSKVTWKAKFANRKCICFIDNDSAMEALIRGFSPSIASHLLLTVNAYIDLDMQSLVWYARVPTQSNPADPPSRLDFETPARLFAAKLIAAKMPSLNVQGYG